MFFQIPNVLESRAVVSEFENAVVMGGQDSCRRALLSSRTNARRKLALWRYDYNHVRPHSSLDNQSPAEARQALELFDGNAPGALATPETDAYQTQGLSL